MKSPIHPCGDRVVVSRLREKTKTDGGIYIPQNGRELPQFGIIVDIGEGVKGTLILPRACAMFGKYAGTEIEALGETFLVLREEEILGVVVDEDVASKMAKDGMVP